MADANTMRFKDDFFNSNLFKDVEFKSYICVYDLFGKSKKENIKNQKQ